MNGLFAVFRSELHRIFALRPVFAVIILAAVVYAAFYPQPYLNEALRNVPIAVVDQDGTQSSRELARLVDATSDVAVALVLPDVASAEREVYLRNIYGILLIPQYFERDLLHGRQSPVALYADASYFLMYQRMSGAVAGVARALGVEIETRRLIGLGVDPAIAAAATDPMPLTAVQLFNPQGGYATYVLPGALILLLQQTLLIGVGLLGTMPGSRSASPSRSEDPLYEAVITVLGKLMAYLAVEVVIVPFYLIGLPYLYGIPRLGSVVSIFAVALPFSLAVAALGMVVASMFRRPLIVQLVLAAVGLPFFFLAGFAWPAEAIPPIIRTVALLLPSTLAIDALVNVAQLGATLSDVRGELWGLWLLALVYGGIAVVVEFRRLRPAAAETVGPGFLSRSSE
ncbi:MAG: ABC transporter permease [Xanthobacteraceae bacterium]|nr:ABC transporter permease [Xanthobacteraceae bacterium]